MEKIFKMNFTVNGTLTTGKVAQISTDGTVKDYVAGTGIPIGIAQNSTGTILLKGISNIHSNLTIGKTYYFDGTGNLSSSSGTYLGYSISSTEIYVDKYILTY